MEPDYRRFATDAFAGIPPVELLDDSFRARAFGWPGRGGRRLLVKEVNPRAACWYLRTFAPELLLLVRHPAAVADSYLRAGWWPESDMEAFGREYGDAVAFAIESAQRTGATLLQYEDFALDPATHFLWLFRTLAVRVPPASNGSSQRILMRPSNPGMHMPSGGSPGPKSRSGRTT